MFGRLLRVTGTVLVIAIGLVTPVLVTATATPASAATVIDGCTIVANPTAANFTNCPGANFSSADLLGVNLDFANLAGANFDGAQLAQCVLDSTTNVASCSSATLEDAALSQATFTGATTSSCVAPSGALPDCVGVDLTGANLQSATLSGLDLSDATLTSADLVGATVVGTTFAASIPIGSFTDFVGAQLASADLAGLNLSGLDLVNVTLIAANLSGAQLQNSDLAQGTNPGGVIAPLGGALENANFTNANLSGANLTGDDLVNTTLSGTNFTGATLTGADLTGTILIPQNQGTPAPATSPSGGVVTWPTPAGLPGATPGACTPASGSTFAPGTWTVVCQVLDDSGNVATGMFTVFVDSTFVGVPSSGATVSGDSWLDAGASSPVGVASVSFELSGGSLSDQVISGSTLTGYGYIGAWNSTSVPNGTYTIESVATDTDGVSTTSAPITITVNNPPDSTSMLIPTNGATLSGTELLDAGSTAGVSAVSFEVSGGTLSNQVVSASAPTIYGWLGGWNSTSVPNGTYTLQSVGTLAAGGTVTSAPITITVSN